MKPERWQHIEQLYHAALEREPAARESFLAEACAGDEPLRRQVTVLLNQDDPAFIARPRSILRPGRWRLMKQP